MLNDEIPIERRKCKLLSMKRLNLHSSLILDTTDES